MHLSLSANLVINHIIITIFIIKQNNKYVCVSIYDDVDETFCVCVHVCAYCSLFVHI